jgi:hypothetical protein
MGYIRDKYELNKGVVGSESPYAYLLFEKVGEFVNKGGQTEPVLEFSHVLDSYAVSGCIRKTKDNTLDEKYVIQVVRKGITEKVDLREVLHRRESLEILHAMTTYGNLSEVFDADDMLPLEKQLHFDWKLLLDNYRPLLSEDAEENEIRLKLAQALHRLSSGNIELKIQQFIDSTGQGFSVDQKKISGYLRKFDAEGFISLTDHFTIKPTGIRKLVDEFVLGGKGKRWADVG